jgi:hypothetical protein
VLDVVTGDMITEEALPTYMTMLNTLDGVRDETGASKTPWATWTRWVGGGEGRGGQQLQVLLGETGTCPQCLRCSWEGDFWAGLGCGSIQLQL